MPYEINNEDLWIKLYSERYRVGRIRQPALANSLSILANLVKISGLSNSYDGIPSSLKEKLSSACSVFEPGGQWHKAMFGDSDVFYRLEKCSSLISYHLPFFADPIEDNGWGFGYGLPEKAKDLSEVDKKHLFSLIWNKYIEEGLNWLPLNKLITQFQGKRKITWWTSDFSESGLFRMPDTIIGDHLTNRYSWLLDLAFRVGMVNHWIDDQMILMKVEAKYIPTDQIAIPSIIDAFDQPIFDPIVDKKATSGVAIHIDHTLKSGYLEFILGQIPIEHIQFIPIQINKDKLASIYPYGQLNDQLAEQLVDWLSK